VAETVDHSKKPLSEDKPIRAVVRDAPGL